MANKINIGNINISSVKLGTADVSLYLGDEKVYPLAQPTFQGKWLATYSDSHTESADCDATSAITHNEIELAFLVSVEIGDCVTTIGNSAFEYCESLTSIGIPSGVTSIGNGAFYGCSNLISITVNALVPPALGYVAFDNTNNCPIFVPSGSVSAYQSASGWSSYASRIQAIPNS